MIKEEEIAWYRRNVINKYVDEVMKNFETITPKIRKQGNNMPYKSREYRRCKKCDKIKPIALFYKGHHKCIDCLLKEKKEQYAKRFKKGIKLH